ncbi:MAG TPA: polyprenyl synthetase family protein [Planctomycetes bacterium]|nr:polyprenyl synthetase family protein [Planctomycetota bacterium]HIN79923.1 polyprenyl synthetase family protein [Planctomycetota bacterium]
MTLDSEPIAVDPAKMAPKLGKIYECASVEMASLNSYLADEFSSSETFVHELLTHIARFRGKQVRPLCLFLAARCFGPVNKDHIRCAAVTELIHTATLVHDDLLDDSRMRRRVETVNERYGERASILLGDFIYSRGFSISTEVEGVSKLLADTTHNICEGELIQVGSAGDIDLTQETYYRIIYCKTAILYGLACRLGAQLSGASAEEAETLEIFGDQLGLAFQIADDVLDLVGDEDRVGKSLGTDLEKGKMTLPLILLRDRLEGPRAAELRALLEDGRSVGVHGRVVEMLEEERILDEVRIISGDHIDRALAALAGLPGSSSRNALEDLARFVVDRDI